MQRHALIPRAFPIRGRIAVPLVFSLFLPPRAWAAEEPVLPKSPETEAAALVVEALGKNLELLAARQEAAAAAQRVKPAGALPDPMLTVAYENDGASPSLGTEPMTRLAFVAQQAFPFPGKQGLARDVARADAARAATRPERVALSIEASVRRAYAGLLRARENLRLVDEQIQTWRDIADVTRARYTAGMGTQQDLLRAQSEQTRLLQQKRRDEASEKTALAELRRLLFRPLDAPVPTEGRLVPGRIPALPRPEDARSRGLEITPELKEAVLARERGRLAAELARRNLAPDFIASASYMNRGGLPLMWSAGIGVSIPLWAGGKQRPLIAEAESLAESATAAEASIRRRIEGLTEERLLRIEQLAAEARLDAEGILVQDRLSVEAALASYKTGGLPFVTVLEALGTFFYDRRAAVDRLAGLIRAEADLWEFSLDGGAPSGMAPSSATSSTSATAPASGRM